MSNLEANPQESFCAAKSSDGPVSELLYAREVVIEQRGQDYLLRLTASGKLILTK